MKSTTAAMLAAALMMGLACSLFQTVVTPVAPPTLTTVVRTPTATATPTVPKPPREGVFMRAGGAFVELQEEGIAGGALLRTQSTDYPISPTPWPELVVWRSDVDAEFLSLHQADLDGFFLTNVHFEVVITDESVIEITPRAHLETGIYCLIHSDPFVELGTPQPGWCFQVQE